MDIEWAKTRVFNVKTPQDFEDAAITIFHYQYENNATYAKFIDLLGININKIDSFAEIPYLPVEFFKSHDISSLKVQPELIFKSSGTTSGGKSIHPVFSKSLYETSILNSFLSFYGPPQDYQIYALVPDPYNAPDSSLAYMLDFLIKCSRQPESGFYLDKQVELAEKLIKNHRKKKIIFGITYALMDFAEKFDLNTENTIVIETGGMKGQRREVTRQELHCFLKCKFGVSEIHSEYSMCELMSQAYSKCNGIFVCPPWMKIVIKEINDPMISEKPGKSGGINIIDLANIYTCSFISTKDIGVVYKNGTFEVLGRYDQSDIRGCSLLLS